jgi:DNA-binding response OmpR family regulator
VTQLLIVHRDPEIGRDLVQLVKDYTGYESLLAQSESETLVWLRRQPNLRPRILLTQLRGPGLDGFTLGALLGEMFAGLQTLFLPDYAASEQRIEVAGSKVFPEPIDGERLIATIERSVRMFSDARDLFHVLDILQMCCLSQRSGAVQMISGSNVGTVYLRDGQIVHAETATEWGDGALFETVSWGEIEFAYDRSVHAGVETIRKAWNALLIDALEEGRRRALPAWRQQTA